MTEKSLTQQILDKDVTIEELARRVAVLEEALRTARQFIRDDMGEFGVRTDYRDSETLDAIDSALSTPSVGGSLAEENERLRKRNAALEAALGTARDYVWDAKEGHLMMVKRCNELVCADDLARIDAALTGKEPA